jgi:hypothetical protein
MPLRLPHQQSPTGLLVWLGITPPPFRWLWQRSISPEITKRPRYEHGRDATLIHWTGSVHVFHSIPYCAMTRNPPALLLSRRKPLLTSDVPLINETAWASPSSLRFLTMVPHACTRAFVLQLTLAHCSCRHALACWLQGARKPFLTSPYPSFLGRGVVTTPAQASDATAIPCLRATTGDALAPAAEFAWSVPSFERRSKP